MSSFTVPDNLHSSNANGNAEDNSFSIKAGLAQMLKVKEGLVCVLDECNEHHISL